MPGRPQVLINDGALLPAVTVPHMGGWDRIYFEDHLNGWVIGLTENDTGDDAWCVYSTTDGGLSWSREDLEDVASGVVASGIMTHESWSPNTAGTGFNTGSKMFMAWLEGNSSICEFTYLDTLTGQYKAGADHGLITTPTPLATTTRFQGKSARPYMVQTSDGDLHFVYADDNAVAQPQHWRSSDDGATWDYAVDSNTAPFPDSVNVDDVMPVAIGDNKIMFLWWDGGSDEILYRIWDNDDDTWDQAATSISTGYEGAGLVSTVVGCAPWKAIWIPNDAHGVERVVLSIAVSSLTSNTGDDLDFWEYAVATNTWTQKASVDLETNNPAEFMRGSTLFYQTDTGRIYCAYIRDSGTSNNVYSRYTDDGGTTWSSETDHNVNVDTLVGLCGTKYGVSTSSTFSLTYTTAVTNSHYINNAEVFYPYPITTDYSQVSYVGVVGDWTIDMNGPTSKGLEILNDGIGVKWQNQIAPYSAGFYKSIPTFNATGKVLLVSGEKILTGTIGDADQGGLTMRLTSTNGTYGDFVMGGDDTLEGAQTLLVSGDQTPFRLGTENAEPVWISNILNGVASASSIDVTQPTTAEDHIAIVAFVADSGTVGVTSWPAGFTEVAVNSTTAGSGMTTGFAWKKCGASEGTWTLTLDETCRIKCVSWSADNVDLTNPIAGWEFNSYENDPEGAPPPINITNNGELLFALNLGSDVTPTQSAVPSEDYVELVDDEVNGWTYLMRHTGPAGGETVTPPRWLHTGELGTEESHNYMISLAPDFGTGFDKTAIDTLGFYYRTNTADQAKNDPPWVFKGIKAGSYITARGGTAIAPMDYEDVRQWSEFFQLGLVTRQGDGFSFFAKLNFNDDSGDYDLYFKDFGKDIWFPPSGVGDSFLAITIEGHASTTTDIVHGLAAGNGGCKWSSAPDRFGNQDKLSVYVDDLNIDKLQFFGHTFLKMKWIHFGDFDTQLPSGMDFVADTCIIDTVERVWRNIDPSHTWKSVAIYGDGTNEGLVTWESPVPDFDETKLVGNLYGLIAKETGDHELLSTFEYSGNTFDFRNESGGHIDLIRQAGMPVPTVSNDTGATTTIVPIQVSFEITVVDKATQTPLTGYEWRLYVDDPAQGVIGTVELAGAESAGTSTVEYLYEYSADETASLQILASGKLEYLKKYTLGVFDQSVTIELDSETNS